MSSTVCDVLDGTSTPLAAFHLLERATEMGAFRAEMRGEMAEFRAEVRGELAEMLNRLTAVDLGLRTSMNRWAIAMATSNTIAVVTALAT